MFNPEEKQSPEGRGERSAETSAERREQKEAEIDPELKIAASKERADYLVKEVKTNKQQMQNIVNHVTQVQQALKALRAQLQLADDNNDPSSVLQDKERVEALKKQIKEHIKELSAMRDDLVSFEIQELQKQLGATVSMSEIKLKAEEAVDSLLQRVSN
jgi:predicted RNase H-like nuclease (RuvC/YqgF family)